MINYRTPTLDDAQALADLGRQTFVDTFGTLYSTENLQPFLEANYSLAALQADLNNHEHLLQVAEEANGQMIGYCKLAMANSFPGPFEGRHVMMLKQLYLKAAYHGMGVADQLMEWTLGEARSRGYDDIVLSVFSENPRAQRFYQRYGFEKYMDYFFMVGDHRDEEFLYRLKVRR
jgi:diamine N-acetyltransferase